MKILKFQEQGRAHLASPRQSKERVRICTGWRGRREGDSEGASEDEGAEGAGEGKDADVGGGRGSVQERRHNARDVWSLLHAQSEGGGEGERECE